MTVLALAVDLSSNNGTPNLREHYHAGYRVLILKSTEGTTYAWDESHSLAQQWHALGGICWHYHFGHHDSTPAAQADWFWQHVKADLADGDRVVYDAETNGLTDGDVSAFWARYITHDPATPRVDYGSPYFLRDNNIRPQHGEALWLADYGPQPSFTPPGWKKWLAWQFIDRATQVPGIPGAVDLSHLAPEALPKAPGPPKPKPTPQPVEDTYMKIYVDPRKTPNPAWRIVNDGGMRIWIQDEPEEKFWIGEGVPVKALSAYEAKVVLDRIPIQPGTPTPK